MTADVLISQYTSQCRIKGTERGTGEKKRKKFPTGDLVKMAEFLLMNNYFEFNGQVKHEYVRVLALNLHPHMRVFSWIR